MCAPKTPQQIGYLAAVSADERVAIEGDPQFRFVFAQGGYLFYKTTRMEELDDELGDIQVGSAGGGGGGERGGAKEQRQRAHSHHSFFLTQQAAIKDREDALLRALAERVLEEEVSGGGGG